MTPDDGVQKLSLRMLYIKMENLIKADEALKKAGAATRPRVAEGTGKGIC